MSRRLFSHSLLRGIVDKTCETRMLTNPNQPSSTSEILTMSPCHLPDVRVPVQYLIDMGLRPALARRISSAYMDLVARYRQVFESHFRRVIHGGVCHIRSEYYRDTFVIQLRGTIQVWESRIMSTAWAWLCRAGLSRPNFIDVRIPVCPTCCVLIDRFLV